MADQPNSATRRSSDCSIQATIEGNRFEVLETGSARLRALLEIIRGARESLSILFYIFDGDSSGRQVRDALSDAARRGVRVRLLVDGYGSSTAEPAFFQPIDDGGGDYCVFNPRYGARYLVRNHQKLAIADDRIAILGGANIQDGYLTDEGAKHWRDLWLQVEGPIVATAARYFAALYRWTKTKNAKLRNLRRIVARHSQTEGVLQWKFSGPLSRKNSWPAALAREMADAARVDVIAAYFAPPGSVLRRLGRVGRRGTARVITAGKSDNNATIGAARHTYTRLLRRGVQMYEYKPARLHTKLAVVDDVVHFGSANLDFRSLYINLEIMLRIDDPGFAAAMRLYFEGELANSERITQALHRSRATLWRRIKWTISHWLVTSMDYTVTRRLNLND